MGHRRRTRRAEAQGLLEREAAELIDQRIADGRPPPEVWQAAAARRGAKGLPADSWYRPADDPASPTPKPMAPERERTALSEGELVLRVVRVPPEVAASSSPAPGSNAGVGGARIVAGTFN